MDVNSQLMSYPNEYVTDYDLAGTYDVNYNMQALVRSGVGLALTFDKPEYNGEPYVFRQLQYLKPLPTILIWRKNRHLTRLAAEFLQRITALKNGV